MAVKIAVCDDEKIFCDQITKFLKDIFNEHSVECTIDCFLTGEALCSAMAHDPFDLIFLDIELASMNGVEVGTYIREHLKNEIVQIAYISSQTKYSMQLFESRPINFLVKPISYDALESLIKKYLLITATESKIFVFKYNREYQKIPLSDIIYLTSCGKKVTVITTNAEYEFYDTLSHAAKALDSDRFFFVHKSFIVNYRYIKKYKFTEIIMTNGAAIPISRSHQHAVRLKFMELKNKEM